MIVLLFITPILLHDGLGPLLGGRVATLERGHHPPPVPAGQDGLHDARHAGNAGGTDRCIVVVFLAIGMVRGC